MVPTITWQDNYVVMIDQRKLPFKESYVVCKTPAQVVNAIRKMVIRGAPAIGVAAAMGLALGASRIKSANRSTFERHFSRICEQMARARPTASNLFWAIQSMQEVLKQNPKAGVTECWSPGNSWVWHRPRGSAGCLGGREEYSGPR
jgi:methylthioribose-1-phosphate isomerase